jgi:O-antigen/teichoic acid export membrane protein
VTIGKPAVMGRIIGAAVVMFIGGVFVSRMTAHHSWYVVVGTGLAMSLAFVAIIWWSGPQKRRPRKPAPELPRRVFRARTPG